MSREAMKQALHEIHNLRPLGRDATEYSLTVEHIARTALDALDAPGKPLGWVAADEVAEHFRSVSCGTIYRDPGEGRVPLYAAPVGFFCLTTREILDIVDDHTEKVGGLPMLYRDQAAALARNIEAKLKEKNAY